jgi:aryl-alcohol dehydrogenase
MKVRAAVSREGAPAPILETLDLEEPRDSEVLVRIVATGICHTDVRVHAGMGPGTPRPIVLGHEGAGVIEKLGAGVKSLAIGDHIVLSGASCGRCPSCQHNAPIFCREMMPRNFGGLRMDGSSALSKDGERIHAQFFGQSSFAQYAIADQRSVVKVPKDVPLDILGPLGCGVITGTGAVIEALQVRAGDTIAIIGTGGVGLSAVMAARIVGASRIVAIDVLPKRLELAKELGATDTVDARDGNVVEKVRELVADGVNFTFNTTSTADNYSHAIDCLAVRGTAGFVTSPRGDWKPPMFTILAGGRKLQGIIGGDAAPQFFIPMLIDYHRQGRLPFDRLIRFYRFDEIATAFADMARGDTIKPVLRMEP